MIHLYNNSASLQPVTFAQRAFIRGLFNEFCENFQNSYSVAHLLRPSITRSDEPDIALRKKMKFFSKIFFGNLNKYAENCGCSDKIFCALLYLD